jgi:hypothetical protein
MRVDQAVVEPMLVGQRQAALETHHPHRRLKGTTAVMGLLLALILAEEAEEALRLLAGMPLLVHLLMRSVAQEQPHPLAGIP